MSGRAPCGCPITYKGVTVHRIHCHVRVGTPKVFPPTAKDIETARTDIKDALYQIWIRAGEEYDRACDRTLTPADVDTFIEWAKQRLNVIALARAVLPSSHGEADTKND